MITRREILPMIAGATGIAAAAGAADTRAAATRSSEPELKRVAYKSARTGKEREYFVYLPRGFKQKDALELLRRDVASCEAAVNRVKVKLTQDQFDALVS